MLQVSMGWAQTIGQRDYQQDGVASMLWPNGFALAVLSDGMGGAVHGDIASQEIIQGFTDSFCRSEEEDLSVRLQDSAFACNQHLADIIEAQPECHGMGGTLIGAAFTGEHLHWVSVGDSPLWLIRDQQVQRINADHSRKAELHQLVAAGMMEAEEVAVHPQRNQLTSAIMGFAIEQMEVSQISLQANDWLLLASDGVETLTAEQLLQLAAEQQQPQQFAEQCIAAVEQQQRPYQDNATVLVLRLTAAAAAAEQGISS